MEEGEIIDDDDEDSSSYSESSSDIVEALNAFLQRDIEERAREKISIGGPGKRQKTGQSKNFGAQVKSRARTKKYSNPYATQLQYGKKRETSVVRRQKDLSKKDNDPYVIKYKYYKQRETATNLAESQKSPFEKVSKPQSGTAIQGVSTLTEAPVKHAKLITPTERPSVLQVEKKAELVLKPRQWVRIKTGLYKDDLGRVGEPNLRIDQITLNNEYFLLID